jgi:hypothetical protein
LLLHAGGPQHDAHFDIRLYRRLSNRKPRVEAAWRAATGFSIPFRLTLAGMVQFALKPMWGINYVTHEYREGSKDVREGRCPTNADYGAALEVALQEAGYTAQDARPLAAVARSERVLCGLLDHEPVPMIPARLAC